MKAIKQKTIVACAAPYGVAGLGQHLAQVVEQTAEREDLECYYACGIGKDDPRGRLIETPAARWLFRYTPIRFNQAWKTYVSGDLFDRAVTRRLSRTQVFHTFSYHSLHSLRRARFLGCERLVLESASVHVSEAMRQQQKAFQVSGISEGWANEALRRRTLREYELADEIFVASELSHQSFLAEGVPPGKLRRRYLGVNPRFIPPTQRPDDGLFRVVCVGSLSPMKGTTVLLDAFARWQEPKARLTLVGGWGTRAMRLHVQRHLRRDSRITVALGDPLPYFHNANVCVHPSFTDGFGYAPMEALACGVPVIVSEDTGMKEYVREGVNGYLVPSGNSEAILDRLVSLTRRPLRL